MTPPETSRDPGLALECLKLAAERALDAAEAVAAAELFYAFVTGAPAKREGADAE